MQSKNRMMVFKNKGKDQEVSIRCVHHCAQLRCAPGSFDCYTDRINPTLLWVLVFLSFFLFFFLSNFCDLFAYLVVSLPDEFLHISLESTGTERTRTLAI